MFSDTKSEPSVIFYMQYESCCFGLLLVHFELTCSMSVLLRLVGIFMVPDKLKSLQLLLKAYTTLNVPECTLEFYFIAIVANIRRYTYLGIGLYIPVIRRSIRAF